MKLIVDHKLKTLLLNSFKFIKLSFNDNKIKGVNISPPFLMYILNNNWRYIMKTYCGLEYSSKIKATIINTINEAKENIYC